MDGILPEVKNDCQLLYVLDMFQSTLRSGGEGIHLL